MRENALVGFQEEKTDLSNRTSLTAPDGSITTYGYDTLNRLNGLANSWAGSFGFGYDALSRRTSLTSPNGVNTSYSYDSLSRLLSVLHQAGGATIDGASYTYDNAGNRTSKTNYLNGITENYTYDALYELTQVTQGANTTESYSYDPVGNRLSSLGVPLYNYNSSNELTSTTLGGYTYDANGNTLSDASGKGYTWDFENRLTQASVPQTGGGSTLVTFKYDPFGRRIQKMSTAGATTYLYDGSNMTNEMDASGSWLARYSYGARADEPLSQLRSGVANYYAQDALDSVTSALTSTGTLADTYVYDAFGNATTSTGSDTNPFRYTSRELDAETGIYFYRARYYDTQTGRFVSQDPINFAAGINFYAYASNSPLLLTDPTGTKYATDNSEAWNDYWNVGNVFQVIRGRNYATEALAAAKQWAEQQNLPEDSLHNGPADAFRHCFWSCTMTQYIGEFNAEIIADQHEIAGNRHGQPAEEEQMDRANNLAGRTAAQSCPKSKKNCWDLCTDFYNHRRLYGLGAHPMDPE